MILYRRPCSKLEGEGYKTEFKEKLTELDREIVAFANANGGSIFVGVKDNGTIIGINLSNRLKSQIFDIARNCDPTIHIELIPHTKADLLEITVRQ